MKAKQNLGQNFLMHQKTADRIASSAGFPPGAHVLEIGPGTGMLTRSLLAQGAVVTAVETDTQLIPQLSETFSSEITTGSLSLVSGDVRTFDFTTFAMKPQSGSSTRRRKSMSEGVPEYDGAKSQALQERNRGIFGSSYYVVANIPYYITGEIIRLLLTTPHKPTSITLLVQKEVAVRICRAQKESILSLSVKVYGKPSYLFTVPRGAFRPAPNVDSAVLHVESIHNPFRSKKEESFFFEVLHAGFGHKRKKLSKNMEAVALASDVSSAFASCSLDMNVRAEELSLTDWKALVSLLKK